MIKEYKFGNRLSVEFDSESYYYGDEYFGSWDSFGEGMADAVNKLLELSEKKTLDLIDKKIEKADTIGAEILKDLKKELTE